MSAFLWRSDRPLRGCSACWQGLEIQQACTPRLLRCVVSQTLIERSQIPPEAPCHTNRDALALHGFLEVTGAGLGRCADFKRSWIVLDAAKHFLEQGQCPHCIPSLGL